ncbi:hypothetical protein [Streptomyces sp. NBC_01320]|uniref:hypothetical protein n=1 Tax=Streptomyces sp. NBC_01320 TaxID=2903824 RepID=UPI002E11CA3C|nr:hypothetical protein OG395_47295 [Streptomyces sp. NBC_01320]
MATDFGVAPFGGDGWVQVHAADRVHRVFLGVAPVVLPGAGLRRVVRLASFTCRSRLGQGPVSYGFNPGFNGFGRQDSPFVTGPA